MSVETTSQPADPPLIDDQPVVDFEPAAQRLISDVETLRALSDPLRLRILEAMLQDGHGPWSAKDLAEALDVPQTRLYHHIEQLVARDLIRPAERRIVGRVVETRYRVVARSLQLDRSLFSTLSEEGRAGFHDSIAAIFDVTRDELAAAFRLGLIDASAEPAPERRLLVSRGTFSLTAERAAELRERLIALLAEFEADASPEGQASSLLIALYPQPAALGGFR
ncbi:MAG TPA: helix-turn-helix domain-containing protein [Candidatus Limnocylindrales bacterium]|nr:helix-turn-helix domain-containing protein [Candidatus Limnocylindrales bacterium]